MLQMLPVTIAQVRNVKGYNPSSTELCWHECLIPVRSDLQNCTFTCLCCSQGGACEHHRVQWALTHNLSSITGPSKQGSSSSRGGGEGFESTIALLGRSYIDKKDSKVGV